MDDKQIVVPIFGMHRSGTSMLTQLLSHMGVELGEPLQPPSFDNPKGFWENRFFQAANIDLLETAQCDVNGFASEQTLKNTSARLGRELRFGDAFQAIEQYIERSFRNTHWGWKDPRTVITLPYWLSCLKKLGFSDIRPIIILRHPDACIQSLIQRGDFNNCQTDEGLSVEDFIAALWVSYDEIIDLHAPPDSIVIV